VRLDSRRAYQLADFRNVGSQEFAEIVRRRSHGLCALRREAFVGKSGSI
jgi:hypothetical protein